MASIDPRTPILVGGSQFTQRTVKAGKVAESLSPIEMLAKVSRLALADAGAGERITAAIDTIAVVRFTSHCGRVHRRVERTPWRRADVLASAAGGSRNMRLATCPDRRRVCGEAHDGDRVDGGRDPFACAGIRQRKARDFCQHLDRRQALSHLAGLDRCAG